MTDPRIEETLAPIRIMLIEKETARRNAAALADQWQATANEQRARIEALERECAALRKRDEQWARKWEAAVETGSNLVHAMQDERDAALAEVERLRAEIAFTTDDDAITDIVQEALADLGRSDRLADGEFLREFCNRKNSEILNALRVRLKALRAEIAQRTV